MTLSQKIPKEKAICAIRKLCYDAKKPMAVGFDRDTGIVGASQTLEDYFTVFMCTGLTPGKTIETGNHIIQVLSPKETADLLESTQSRKQIAHE